MLGLEGILEPIQYNFLILQVIIDTEWKKGTTVEEPYLHESLS